MAMLTSGVPGTFLPEQIAALIIRPVAAASVALQVSTVIHVNSAHTLNVPIVAADASAAWVAEGADIPLSDVTLAEDVVQFAKLAGVTKVSRELAEDSSPAAATIVGMSLARDIARKLDTAFFGNLAAPAPTGLGGLVGFTSVLSGGFANLDSFLGAIAAAEGVGATVTAFVVDPTVGLALAKLKVATGSNQTILGFDATSPTKRTIAGVPLYVTSACGPNMAWAICKDRVIVGLRNDVRLEVSRDAYFIADMVGIKATLRAGFSFPHPASVIKITAT